MTFKAWISCLDES
jgi:hypothetical protein